MRRVLFLGWFVLFMPNVFSETIYVPDDHPKIQQAIDAANNGDSILVRPGTYGETVNLLGKFVILESLSGAQHTVIDGGRNGSVVTFESGETQNTVLRGFTITNGTGTEVSEKYEDYVLGGGLYCLNASPTLEDLFIMGNSAGIYEGDYNFGGGMYSKGGSPNLIRCTFTWNWAYRGGGIYNQNSSARFHECTIDGNFADDSGGGIYNNENSQTTFDQCLITWNVAEEDDGGGAVNRLSDSILNDCSIIHNTADNGGGMANLGSSVTMIKCDFIGNNGYHRGGGLLNDVNSPSSMIDCRFVNNASFQYGGGIYIENSTSVTINRCRFKNNAAKAYGGALSIHPNSLVDVTNCLFIGNYSKDGAGIYLSNNNYSSSITNCTFYGNNADEFGGAVVMYHDSPDIRNCVFWGNRPSSIALRWASNPVVTHCCTPDFTTGQYDLNSDPMFADPSCCDFRLSWISPCINRGTSEGAPPDDLDGDPRPFMGEIDMGADEFIGLHPLESNVFTLSVGQGGTIDFSIDAGLNHAYRYYVLIGSLKGTIPGTPLPSGMILPMNWDGFTDLVVQYLNSPFFVDFLGVLDGNGRAIPRLKTNGLPPVWEGEVMQFAYTLDDPFDFVSNPIRIDVVE